ncbi:MAG: aspartate--tRNA(Asn) ligase [Aigarchaeota archaeon]|nr:aspartate--tRNA(Asn) ligase [Aigarchaeota archaeon]MCX8192255.1 aspartate--tRNA(Asn) ligase [Nitrososphaeria archaeon]MDW7986137.1 aspartate--tRNA(Asn) ligase [Nitrososphaerota archaeon]
MRRKLPRRSHYASEIKPNLDGCKVALLGWAHEVRDLGGIKFILLRDVSGTCQVTIKKEDLPREVLEKVEDIGYEDVVYVEGFVKSQPKARLGVEVVLENIEILSRALRPIPYDVTGKVSAGIDTRLDHRILDLRKPENNAIFKIADTVLTAAREFFRMNNFIEVRTPRIIATATEGGAALFEVKYFDSKAYLAQSPQLYKEELVTVFERVFEIGPFFRAEESHTRRHVSEFTSVDIEAAFLDLYGVMEILENLIVHIYKKVVEEREKELELLNVKLDIPETPFPRYTYNEMVEELKTLGLELEWGEDFGTEHLRILGEKHRGYYFITHFPTKSKPFYIQPCEDNPELSESFDLMYSWLELASGGTRISNRSLLEKRLMEQGLNVKAFEHHLKVYDYGMPIHAGWGLGLDRLLMILTNRENIREVILFPRDKFRLVP